MATSKERIMAVTAEFFGRQGYSGTGMKQILEAANAPFGSLYHHFPGGKEELGIEVISRSGEMYRQLFETVFDVSKDAADAIRNFFNGAAETLTQSNYADACPIATIALEVASTNEPLRKATADVFTSWLDAMGKRFVAAGIPKKKARDMAIVTLAALEGAFILSRAMRSPEPVKIAGAFASAAVDVALLSRGRVSNRATTRLRGAPGKNK